MADDKDNVDQKASSLEMISKVWSSLTSNENPDEDPNDTTTSTVTSNANDEQEGSANENEDGTTASEEMNDESRRSSILSNIFSRFNSTDNSENDSNVNEGDKNSNDENNTSENTSTSTGAEDASATTSESDGAEAGNQAGSFGIISNFISSFTSVSTENSESGDSPNSTESEDVATGDQICDLNTENVTEDEAENQRRGSLGIISDLISSFTSVSDENKDDLQSGNANEPTTTDAEEVDGDVLDDTADVKEQDSFNQRVRSSSSALYTEPENIDKKDLDYVTLVSS